MIKTYQKLGIEENFFKWIKTITYKQTNKIATTKNPTANVNSEKLDAFLIRSGKR